MRSIFTLTNCTFFSSEDTPINPRCTLSLDQGSCRNYSIHWYYDKQANSCAQFWYGGCEGNGNRYETEDECKRTCVVHPYRAGLFFFYLTIKCIIDFNLNTKLFCPPQDKRRLLRLTPQPADIVL